MPSKPTPQTQQPPSTTMDVRDIPIAKINPAPYNPKQPIGPGDKEYEDIKASIMDFTLVEPLVWNEETGNLVGGHARLQVLKDMGAMMVPCNVLHITDLATEMALNLALTTAKNKLDRDRYAELVGSLSRDAAQIDIKRYGITSDELADTLRQYQALHAADWARAIEREATDKLGPPRGDPSDPYSGLRAQMAPQTVQGTPPTGDPMPNYPYEGDPALAPQQQDPTLPGPKEVPRDPAAAAFVQVAFSVSEAEREEIWAAINAAKKLLGTSNSVDALVEVCRSYAVAARVRLDGAAGAGAE